MIAMLKLLLLGRSINFKESRVLLTLPLNDTTNEN